MAADATTITLLVAGSDPAQPVREQVSVEPLGSGRYRVLATPGLVMGTAAGDVVEVAPDGTPNVLERGGNVAVQLYAADVASDELTPALVALGGRLDGRIPDTLSVYTVPAAVGFPAIQAVLEWLGRRHPDAEWEFGNVWAEDGVTPLDWWQAGLRDGASG
ncbi:DUF4265 domain-containing protein [Thalassiella azotivora]